MWELKFRSYGRIEWHTEGITDNLEDIKQVSDKMVHNKVENI